MSSIIQLEKSLPSTFCFHDSFITNINVDYVKNKVLIYLEICAGDPESTDPLKRKSYEKGILTITDLIYFIIEPPDHEFLAKYPSPIENEGLWIDIGFGQNPSKCTKLPQTIPKGAFYNWIFVRNWNSFIHIAAMNAKIEI